MGHMVHLCLSNDDTSTLVGAPYFNERLIDNFLVILYGCLIIVTRKYPIFQRICSNTCGVFFNPIDDEILHRWNCCISCGKFKKYRKCCYKRVENELSPWSMVDGVLHTGFRI